jgi:hypothetical protein
VGEGGGRRWWERVVGEGGRRRWWEWVREGEIGWEKVVGEGSRGGVGDVRVVGESGRVYGRG